MAGTITALYQKEMRKANVEPIVQVAIQLTSPSSTNLYVSNQHHTTGYDVDNVIPILMGVTDVSQSVDPIKRNFQIGTIQIELLNDPYVRTLMASHHWYNAKVLVTVGTEALTSADYMTLFYGEIKRVYADFDRIIVDCSTRNSKLKDYMTPQVYVGKHPAEILRLSMNAAGIEDGAIDTATFASDAFATYAHYCFSSYGIAPYFRDAEGAVQQGLQSGWTRDSQYGSTGAGSYENPVSYNIIKVKTEEFAREYCEMTGLTFHNDTASKAKLSYPDPDAAVTRHLTTDDYSNFEQDPETLIFNTVSVACGPTQNQLHLNLEDSTSISKFGTEEYKADCLYFTPAAQTHPTWLTASTARAGGPGINGFCGTRNLKQGTQTSADQIDSDNPFFGFFRSGIYTTTTAHTDYYPDWSADPWVVTDMGVEDGWIRGVHTLGMSGISHVGGESFTTAHANYYYDITIPYRFAKRILSRFSNGCPKIKFTIGLDQIDLELGDTISIDNDWFASPFLGLDGLDSNTKFEITKKEVRCTGADIGIEIEAVFLISSTSPTVTATTNTPGEMELLPIRPSTNLTATLNVTSTNSVIEGLNVLATSGLSYAIKAGTMLCGGSSRVMANDSPVRTVTASKHTYVGFDASSGSIVYNEVATSAAPPPLGQNEIRLAKVISDGSSITSITDLRQYGATSIRQIDKEAIAPGLTTIWNPGFEMWADTGSAPPGWTAASGVLGTDIIREDSTTHAGSHSAEFANTSTAATLTSDQIPVVPNRVYRASVWLRQNAGFTVNAKIYWYQRDRTASSTASSNIHISSLIATNTWEQKDLAVAAPSDAAFAEIYLNRAASPSPAGVCYFDDVSFREEPPAFSVYNPATTTLSKGVESQIDFQNAAFDFGSGYTAGSSYEYEAIAAGLYQFECALTVDGSVVDNAHSLKLMMKHEDQAASVTTILTAYGGHYGSAGYYVYGQVLYRMKQGEKITVHADPEMNSPVLQSGKEESFFSGRRVSL